MRGDPTMLSHRFHQNSGTNIFAMEKSAVSLMVSRNSQLRDASKFTECRLVFTPLGIEFILITLKISVVCSVQSIQSMRVGTFSDNRGGRSKNRLDRPNTTKSSHQWHNDKLFASYSSMQGWRTTMEDAHRIILSLPSHPGIAYFGVYDGHCGTQASKWCAANIHQKIDSLASLDDISITQALLDADSEFCDVNGNAGCTCCFALVDYRHDLPYDVTVVNVGDSRCVIGRKFGENGVEKHTTDHKPQLPHEKERVEAAGGEVIGSRVEGRLAMSRAVGDQNLKNEPNIDQIDQKITAEPDITHAKLKKGDFLLIACDGIFEKCSSSDVIAIIYEELHELYPDDLLSYVTDGLLDESLRRGSQDNMTAILVLTESIIDIIADLDV